MADVRLSLAVIYTIFEKIGAPISNFSQVIINLKVDSGIICANISHKKISSL